ncbi:protein of unknown function [Flavobacterium succinicans]|uniref:DUF4265 domain-containing protein n=1 Tax=Flavobacterium succinicans TaxID=29536 RepID=A0A1I4WBX6_9FLAO|nr:DUF4265 domain-containing protein [Flavobacterium succinicans]SFN10907.1 protein of unknown function [Flavobacterium succinicans]
MLEKINTEVKILFRFYSNILNDWTVETMCASIIDEKEGKYKLDNIPFYAPVSCGDIISAEFNQEEQRLVYKETIEHSGNSTIQVIVAKNESIENLREMFKLLGCDSEKFSDSYFVMEIPAAISYVPIREKLNYLEEENIISYAEPNLSKNHWY